MVTFLEFTINIWNCKSCFVLDESVYNMQDIMLFQQQEETDRKRVYLGLNNSFDAAIGGKQYLDYF